MSQARAMLIGGWHVGASGWPLVALFGVSLKRVLEAAGRAALMSGSMSCFQSSKVPKFHGSKCLAFCHLQKHWTIFSTIRPFGLDIYK